VSADVLQAARRLAARNELAGASMADIAAEAGITRVTLYRRGETRMAILSALRDELAREERDRLWPILTSDGDARTRLERALEAVCEGTEASADLLAGLDDAALNAIYHEEGDESLTRGEFVAPIVRLLRDGALDGSLRAVDDPDETATVLYVQITYTYRHLAREHGWPAKRAARAVVDLAMASLRA
jgi:AcrR family transcriptional regulator